MSKIRLNKFLADCGVCSRRKADELISEGEVQVNGKVVYELGSKVDSETDRVKCKGKAVKLQSKKLYYVFNKPKNVVTTTSDPLGRPTVLDFFSRIKIRLFPVGRLDWDTEGLIFMTNDGDFSNKISSPKSGIPKTYHAKLDGIPALKQLDKLKRGISIEGGGRVAAISIQRIKGNSDKKAWVEIIISEGKNRQVRKMFAKIGFDVVKLKRVAIGNLKLGRLKSGEHAVLSEGEIERIFSKSIAKNRRAKKKVSIKKLLR